MVELSRDHKTEFGFSIRGGSDFCDVPFYVTRIAENALAALDGRIQVSIRMAYK